MEWAQLGGALGVFYCLFTLVFRWKVVVAKYGQLSLYWWVVAVSIGWAFAGYLVGLLIWGVEYVIWWMSY